MKKKYNINFIEPRIPLIKHKFKMKIKGLYGKKWITSSCKKPYKFPEKLLFAGSEMKLEFYKPKFDMTPKTTSGFMSFEKWKEKNEAKKQKEAQESF